MGMFDEIKCKYPLPDPEVQNKTFQTKHFENLMDWYSIDEEGRLIYHKASFDIVPEEERPYWGTAEWELKPIVRAFGSMKRIPEEDVFMEDFGDVLRMYTIHNNIFYEYKMFFHKGRVSNIIRVFLEKGK
jgi:hypothetical protein